jgi:saccharopine dehydrogenase-like protein
MIACFFSNVVAGFSPRRRHAILWKRGLKPATTLVSFGLLKMTLGKVLIVGGHGYFGRLLIEDLRANCSCQIVVGSRRPVRDERFVDLHDAASLERALEDINIAICAAGPYQKLPAILATLCIERGIHYIDLADDREFVETIRALPQAREAHTAVCTGWSTVSALSGALTQIASSEMNHIDSVQIHMAPGNRGARQTGTITSLLNSVGKRFSVCRDGVWIDVIGWSEPRTFSFAAPIGKRQGYLVDVPDHAIFPDLFKARTVEFRAGSELAFLNRVLSLLRRTRHNWSNWASVFQRAAALFSGLGQNCGAIGVEVKGWAHRRVSIIGESRGERLAVMPAAVMTSALLSGSATRGVTSFKDWITQDQLRNECTRRGFRLIVENL